MPFLSLQIMDFLLCLLTLLGCYIELPAYLKFAARPLSVSTRVHDLTWAGWPGHGPFLPRYPSARPLIPANHSQAGSFSCRLYLLP